MHKIDLQWKEMSIDLQALEAEIKAICPLYVGNQAHSVLELWFSEEPSQEDKDAVNALWAAIDANHAIAQSYKSRAQVQAEVDAQKASARAKLAALGLSEAELQALLG